MLRRSTLNLLLALGFVAGIAVRSWFATPLIAGYVLACAGLATAIIWWRRERVRAGGLIALFLFLGIWRTEVALQLPSLHDISRFAGQTVDIEGVVARDPDVRLKTEKIVMEVKSLVDGNSSNPPLMIRGGEGGVMNGERNPPRPVMAGASSTTTIPSRGSWAKQFVRLLPLDPSYPKRGVSGNLLVIVPAVNLIEVGDKLRLKCEVVKPEMIEEFDYPRYLAKDGIYAQCIYPEILSREPGSHGVRWALARLKRDFQNSLNAVVQEPEGAFLGGILVGSRGRIPETVLEDFQKVGITHLIAISGYNITIIATGVLALLTLFLRRLVAFPFLVLVIAAFTVMVGGSASVVRAAIMGLMLHAAYVSDRLYRPVYGLTLAAALMLALNPRLLRDDLGFDLSFLATLGIMSLGPWFTRKFSRVTARWHIREALAMTCAAQVTTLPLLVGSFDRVSLISPLANLIIVPLIPFIMALGFGAGIIGIIPVLGWIAGNIAWLAAYTVLFIAHALAFAPAATITVPKQAWMLVVAVYALAIVGVWKKEKVKYWASRLMRRFHRPARLMQSKEVIRAMTVETAEISLLDDDYDTRHPELAEGSLHIVSSIRERDSPISVGMTVGMKQELKTWLRTHRIWIGAIVFVAVFMSVSIPSYLKWKRFSVTVFDVGQGDSILVAAPRGVQVLIDGGPDASILSQLGKGLPWWDRTIELVVLTHPHSDHVTGIVEVLKRYKIQKVFITGVLHNTEEYHIFLSELERRSIETHTPIAGEEFELGEMQMTIFHPFEILEGKQFEEPNDTSIVLKVEYNGASFLFSGDAGLKVELQLIERFGDELDVDVLKVGHQGSADASSEEFIAAVSPRFAAISVGKDNQYGHPSARVIKRLLRNETQVVRTDEFGNLQFVVQDGQVALK